MISLRIEGNFRSICLKVTFLAVFFSLSNKFLYAQCENYPGFAATVTANNNSNSITICAGSNLNLASQVNGIPNGQGGSVVYQWSGGLNNYTNTTSDPAVFSIPSNVSGAYIYTMTATLGGCTISDDIQVTVNPLPNPQINLDPNEPTAIVVILNGITTFAYCEGNNSYGFPFIDASIAQPGATYSVAWGNATGTQTYNSSGWTDNEIFNLGATQINYTITNQNGCSSSESFGVYIGSNPAIGMSNPGNTVSLCTGDLVCIPIDSTVAASNPPGTSYYIDFGDGTDTTYVHPTPSQICHQFLVDNCTNPPSYLVQIEALNACSPYNAASGVFFPSEGSAGPFIVSTNPIANFTISPQDTICVGTSVTLSNISSASQAPSCSTPKLAWRISPTTGWSSSSNLGNTNNNFNSTSTWPNNASQNPVFNFNTAGTYCITLYTGNNLCGVDSITKCICVESTPNVAITAAPIQGCAPLNVDVTNNSTANSCAVTRLWTSTQTATGCAPQPGAPTITSPTLLDPTVVFEEAGVYTITLTMTNSCGAFSQTSQPITVKTRPIVTLPTFPSVCAGQSCISPTATVQNCGGTTGPNYSWSFTGGSPINSTQQVPGLVCYNTPGTYTITANAENECGAGTASSSITVSTTPNVILGNDTIICNGSQVPLNAIVSGGTGSYTYSWTPSGSGLSSTNVEDVVATPTSTVEYFLQATDAAGCTKRDSITVTVNQPPTATVSNFATCPGNAVPISATTSIGGSWSANPSNAGAFLDDESASTNYTPLATSTGQITLIWITDDPAGPCPRDTASGTLTINPPALAAITQPFVGCSGGPINISVTSNNDGVWTETGGGTITIPGDANTTYNPVLADTLNPVQLTWITIDPDDGGPCLPDTVSTTLTVSESATSVVGNFTACPGSPIDINATSSGAGYWSANPLNLGVFEDSLNYLTTYTPNPGVSVNITLTWTTSDPDGLNGPCLPAVDSGNLVISPPAVATITQPFVGCSGGPIDISVSSNNGGTWYSTGGGTVTDDNDESTSYNPVLADTLNPVQLTWITVDPDNGGPCLPDTVSTTLTVNSSATSIVGDFTACPGSPVDIVATSSGAGNWTADPANSGDFEDSSNYSTTYTPNVGASGPITLTWTTIDPDGLNGPCLPAIDTGTLTISPPAVATITQAFEGCSGGAIDISVNSNNDGEWYENGVGSISSVNEENTTYVPAMADTLNPVTLTWITIDPDNGGPCLPDTAVTTILIEPSPMIVPLPDLTICSSDDTLVNAIVYGGAGTYSFLWTPSLGLSSANISNPLVTPQTTTEYIIVATDGNGCFVSDTIEVNVLDAGFANAGLDYSSCGLSAIPLNGSSNGDGQWIGGIGLFDNNSEPVTIYSPTIDEVGQTIFFTWTTFDPDGATGPCTSAIDTVVVTISEPATFDTTSAITICSSDVADLSVVTTPITGSWTGGDGTFGNATAPITTYSPDLEDVGQMILYWTTSDPDSINPSNDGPCTSIVVEQIVNVLDAATADAGADLFSCGYEPIALNASANGNGQWSGGLGAFSDSSNTLAVYYPDSSEVGQVILLTWTTFDPDSVSVLDNGPCTGAVDVVSVQINEPAFAEIEDIAPICSNGDAELTVDSYPAGGTWAGGAGQYGDDNQSTTTYTPEANEQAIVIPITWTTEDPDGSGPTGPCEPFVATAEIDILAEAISNITTTYSVCANGILNIDVQENGDGEWTVDPPSAGTFADSSDSSTDFIPSVDYYTAQTLEIKWVTFDPDSTGPCLSAMDSTTVNTLPLPLITMAPSFSIPCGDDISATVATYQNATYTFQWSPTDGLIDTTQLTTPVIQDNEYILQVTDANQCTNADTTLVDAIALANMASAADASTCLYVPIELSGFAANGQGPFTYSWEGIDEVSVSPINDSLANFVFTDYILQDSVVDLAFFVSDSFGCTDDTTINVTVFALPAIDPGQNWNLCEDSPVFTLTNFSPQPNTGISGVWTPSDVVDPDLIGVNAVTYTYTFTDNNGCVNDSSMLVSINEVPQPIMVVPSVACVETPLPLQNNSTCATCSDVSYEWDFGIANSTSTEFEPSFIYSVNDIGLQTVQLVAISGFGCDDTTTAVVDIVLPPMPLFEATYNQPSCAPLAVDISNDTDTTGLYLSYEWTIEDVTENNIVGVYNTFLPPPIVLQQGDSIVDYTITLMVSNVCGNYTTDTIVSVLPQPVADILTSTVYGCTPLVVDFINESVGLPDAIEWDFGDGTFSGMDTPPPHTFYTDSTITIYNLVVALENECGVDTFFQDITVLPNTVNALFVTSTAAGCTPLEVTFTDFSTGASQLSFTLCNGATFSGETFTYTFTEPGDCEVELVADNGCSFDTTVVSIFVVQSPEPTIVADNSYCANETIQFTAENVENDILTWNFDDGSATSAGNPAEHAYADAGDYLVELQAANNLFGVECVGTATQPVHISPNPQAAFTIPTNFGCSPFNLCFTNLSSTSDPNMLLSQQWNFDGVNVETDFSPCHIYPNQTGELVYYTVTLEVTAADINYAQTCSSSTSQNILVLPQPISDFEMADPYTCYFPYELATTNTTVGGGAYQWIFNGQNWTQQTNTTFPINDLGAYNIDLIATNQYGCTDTSQQVFNSYPLPTLDFTFDLNDGCDPLMVQFDNLSTGNNSYTWLFDDGSEATLEDVIHEYTNPGSYEVMLVGTTENNCSDTLAIEDPILVYPVPVADFIYAPTEVNILNPLMTFEETCTGGSFYQWNFNDGSQEYGAIVDHAFNEAYYHAVTLTVYNQFGCNDDITKNVFIIDALTLYTPNAFTPDGDNINDEFMPEIGGKELISRYNFWVTDRWGVVLFRTSDVEEPWLGNINNGDHYVSPDIYIWNVEVELKNGEEHEYNGHVTIVR
jgi:gliding motility-associated-like protein